MSAIVATAEVGAQRQVALPKIISTTLDISDGDKVVFAVKDNQVVMMKLAISEMLRLQDAACANDSPEASSGIIEL